MTVRVARYGIGSLLILLLAWVFFADREAARITPWLALVLGFGALLEYWKICAAAVPGRLRIAGITLGLAVTGWAGMLTANSADFAVLLAATLPCALFLGAMVLLCARRHCAVEAQDFAATLHLPASMAMTVLPSVCLCAMALMPKAGIAFAFTVLMGSKLNDIGGYVGGSLLGRHKLCPGVSPNKTVEGALTGALLGIGGTVLLAAQLPELSTALGGWRAWALGCGLALTTQVGDLFESAFKRSLQVKDSAAILPAYGGLLDLMDSFIFAAPLGYTLARAWLN